MATERNALGTAGPSWHPSSDEPSLTIGANSLAQLMEAIESSHARMEEKFAQFRSEVRLGQEEAAAKALKRARYEKPYSFKKKGNEAQALFNSKLDETLAQAESDAASVAILFLGGLSIMRCHARLIIKPLRCALNHLSRWFGIDAHWCALAEAGLGVEAANSLSHLVNTFAMRINAHYFASVEGPLVDTTYGSREKP